MRVPVHVGLEVGVEFLGGVKAGVFKGVMLHFNNSALYLRDHLLGDAVQSSHVVRLDFIGQGIHHGEMVVVGHHCCIVRSQVLNPYSNQLFRVHSNLLEPCLYLYFSRLSAR